MHNVSFALLALLAIPVAASSQLINLKTVPVAAGDQFLLFPSQTLGLGGVSIAVDDSLYDPLVNPAKGGRLPDTRLVMSPTVYAITRGNGHAVSVPVAMLGRWGRSFGGGGVALQQLSARKRIDTRPFARSRVDQPFTTTLSSRSNRNLYAFAFGGRTLPGSRVSLGASAFAADLQALDGVDLLYASALDVEQSGYLADVRVGMVADLEHGRTFEALLLFNRLSMSHEVTYFNEERRFTTDPETVIQVNLDLTNTWGAHLGYTQALNDELRIGGILTANVRSHPKIPNYELANIPRDPGTSWAYNIGIGISNRRGPAILAVDIIYEPVRLHTWAEAAQPVTAASGVTIPTGAKTVDNRFWFSNAIMRIGLGHDVGIATLRGGLELRSFNYRLRQRDLVLGESRTQSEQWMEWTPSFGATIRLPEFELHYLGRLTLGTGQPGVAFDGFQRQGTSTSSFIPAPSGPLGLADVRVWTQQIAISMPIG